MQPCAMAYKTHATGEQLCGDTQYIYIYIYTHISVIKFSLEAWDVCGSVPELRGGGGQVRDRAGPGPGPGPKCMDMHRGLPSIYNFYSHTIVKELSTEPINSCRLLRNLVSPRETRTI